MRHLLAALLVCAATAAQAAPASNLEAQFTTTVQPFLNRYCAGCHSGATPAGSLDLKSYSSIDQVTADFARWSLAADRLAAKEMPPKPMPAPPAELASQFVSWVHSVRA